MDLPQPLDGIHYKYLTYDEIPSLFMSLQNSLEPLLDSSGIPGHDTLVWVMQSKGKRRAAAELFRRARILDALCSSECTSRNNNNNLQDEPRVLVQYPFGSTYRVRSSFLLPVFEPGKTYPRLVVVVDETPPYRRTAIIHTCLGDSFLEIGCDFGICTDKVRDALQNIPYPSSLTQDGGMNYQRRHDEYDSNLRVSCIGIDKSPTSIDIAKERFPESFFSVEDALTPEGTKKLRTLCREHLIGRYPTVVAIDINGNREITDVIECLCQVIRPNGDDVELNINWELPRLIIIKSRFLFQAMKEHRNGVLVNHQFGFINAADTSAP